MEAVTLPDGITLLAGAFSMYFEELEGYRARCIAHEKSAAIHQRGTELQVYRLFERNESAAQFLRDSTSALPGWQESSFWRSYGQKWKQVESGVRTRMAKHKRLTEIATRGVLWEGDPILVHAYKFDADPVMKVELVIPKSNPAMEDLPLRTIASVLECHEYLVPLSVAAALPPYQRHETKFLTVSEYLSQKMPTELYATQCLQGVSCHASNGVGSRDTPREHPEANSFPLRYGTT